MLGYKVYATTGTHKFFKKHGYKTKEIAKLSENKRKNAVTLLEDKHIELLINTPSTKDIKEEEHDGYMLRRTAVDAGTSLINNIKVAKLFIESLEYMKEKGCLDILSYSEITKK
jgi:carbamoyl-phosphate synthase large subunit